MKIENQIRISKIIETENWEVNNKLYNTKNNRRITKNAVFSPFVHNQKFESLETGKGLSFQLTCLKTVNS